MRRYEKKMILELLDTIDDAQKNKTLEVLMSCQESAISIGNAIEKSEGKGTETVALLERYCEDLYVFSQGIDSPDLSNDIKIIKEKVKNEIKVKLEVAFFPYKASMWDSMESIYTAFKERSDVNTWLVPIPYYNRKNDGTVDKMHCESNLFPKGETVTDWKAFDVSKIKPDIAFIHNPYDDMNYVTTVDPLFYSSELKKNVDCLVYCPYFSTNGGLAKEQSLCKAYLYVDYILVQSEMQAGLFDPAVPKNKLLIAGSPKFDKVIRLTREKEKDRKDFFSLVPEDWYQKCNDKRIYFYNTSISGLLANTPAFLKKMDYVFNTFSKQKDVVLLWRPHPLLESTIEALRPEYYENYLKLKEKFISDKIGILDTTADISTSVALSDAFIGDGATSITSLFGVSGKPVFLLNNDITREPDERDIIESVITTLPANPRQDGCIITEGNQIYKCDLPFKDELRFHYYGRISNYANRMYSECYEYKNSIYITPSSDDKLLIRDMDGNFSNIALEHLTDNVAKFFTGIAWKNYIIMIPNEYPYIVRIDLESREVKYIKTDLRKIFVAEISNKRSCGGIIVKKNNLLISSLENSHILCVNMDTMNYKIIKAGKDFGYGYSMLYYNEKDDSILMVSYENLIIRKYNILSGQYKDFNIKVNGFICSDSHFGIYDEISQPFSSYIIKDGNMYLAPCKGNKFVRFNIKSGMSQEWEFPIPLEWNNNRFFSVEYSGLIFPWQNRYFWYSAITRRLYEIDVQPERAKIIGEVNIRFDIDEIKKYAYGFSGRDPWNGYGMMEDAVNPLSKFITGEVNGKQFDKNRQLEEYKKASVNLDGTCGQKVCDFLVDKIYL